MTPSQSTKELPAGASSGSFRWTCLLGGTTAMIVLGALLYFFPPDRHCFYPICLFKTLTGWECPGCGGLRAAHHFLHGRIGEAWRMNPFMFLAGTWMAAVGVVEIYRWRTRRVWPNPLRGVGVLWTMTLLMILFGVFRNAEFPRW